MHGPHYQAKLTPVIIRINLLYHKNLLNKQLEFYSCINALRVMGNAYLVSLL